MKSVLELDDKEILIAYASATKRYEEVYKEKKDLEEEMKRRYNRELDTHRG